MKIRILRAMCFGGARHESDSVIDVADPLARELVAQGRAARAEGGAEAPPAGPMTTATAGALLGDTAAPAKKGK